MSLSDLPVDKKVVVITGASSGLGKGMARRFARAGASVVLAARREMLLDDLARECEACGVQAIAVPTDVSRQDEVERLADTALSTFGGFDLWINNAGVGALGRFDEVPLADHVQIIETNLLGVIYGSYFALRQFRLQQSGTLINVAAALGKIPAPYYSSYTAAKFGVVGLSAALRQELRENGEADIQVCTVLPMATDTPFLDHASNYTGHEAVPIPPLHDPESVVDAIFELSFRPQDELVMGAGGQFMVALHNVAPGMVEAMLGHTTHTEQMEKAAVAADTAGSVHEPVATGTEVSAGRLQE